MGTTSGCLIQPVRSGTHAALEDEATRLIRDSLVGVTKHSEKSDVLTVGKEKDRRLREVYLGSRVERERSFWDETLKGPDAAIRKGIYSRAVNLGMPHLNSREGVANVLPRQYSVTLWDLRTAWPDEFPVTTTHFLRKETS